MGAALWVQSQPGEATPCQPPALALGSGSPSAVQVWHPGVAGPTDLHGTHDYRAMLHEVPVVSLPVSAKPVRHGAQRVLLQPREGLLCKCVDPEHVAGEPFRRRSPGGVLQDIGISAAWGSLCWVAAGGHSGPCLPGQLDLPYPALPVHCGCAWLGSHARPDPRGVLTTCSLGCLCWCGRFHLHSGVLAFGCNLGVAWDQSMHEAWMLGCSHGGVVMSSTGWWMRVI